MASCRWLLAFVLVAGCAAPAVAPTPGEPVPAGSQVSGVARLTSGHWDASPDGFLRSRPAYSEAWPAHPLAEGARVTLVVRDHDQAWHEAGYLSPPGDVAGIHVLHRWLGTGSGAWRDESFDVPPDARVDGPLYVSDGLVVLKLQVAP